MIQMQHVSALLVKQLKDSFRNMPVLVLFIVYPCIAIIMTKAMPNQPETQVLFLGIFATMHCVFTPIVSASSIISEEKEKNTLRVLIMSNVTLREYFISIGGFILLADLLTGSTFLFVANYNLVQSILFLLSLGAGCLISIIIGICIGLYSHNTSAASGIAVPIGMVFAFLPMLSSFNKSIEQVSRFTYGQQISYLILGKNLSLPGIIAILLNTSLFLVLALVLYRRSLTEE